MDWSVSEVRIPIPHGPAVAWLARQICAALFLEDDCNKSDPADEGDTREAGGICAAADIAADARDMQAVTINKVDDGDVTTSTDCSTIDELDGARPATVTQPHGTIHMAMSTSRPWPSTTGDDCACDSSSSTFSNFSTIKEVDGAGINMHNMTEDKVGDCVWHSSSMSNGCKTTADPHAAVRVNMQSVTVNEADDCDCD
jgi:hypothetical protein